MRCHQPRRRHLRRQSRHQPRRRHLEAAATAPLFEGLGDFSHPITVSNPLAQRYFDQGMVLSFGFNHAEAERSFRYAAELDESCAMCWWGVAYVLGPNINAPMSPKRAPRLGKRSAGRK